VTVPDDKPASSAGRGVVYIAFAKLYFMVVGFVIQIRLPALLSRAAFGAFSLVSNIASLVNNVLVTGTINAVSKFAAQEPEKARQVQAAGLRMHLVLGLGIAAAFAALAPVVAWLFHDPSKTAPLMLAGLIVAGYSFYAVFIGTANGLHQFHKQAGLDMTFATLRAAGLLGMAAAGFGVVGVIGGWVVAAALILCVAIAWVGVPGRGAKTTGERFAVRPLVTYFGGLAVYLVLLNALMFVDTFLLKRLTDESYGARADELAAAATRLLPWARPATGYTPDPSALADVQVAYYVAVQNLARLSYQAIIAATFVVFPMMARSTFVDDRDASRRYVEVTTRYSLVFATLIAVVMAGSPTEVLGLVYAPDYAETGGPALAALALGNVAFSIFAIAGTILNAAGRTRPAIALAAVTLAIATIGNYIAIRATADSGHVLEVAATVTGVAMLLGAVMCGVVLKRSFGGFLPMLSLVRVVVAAAVAIAVDRALPLHGKLMTLVGAAVVAATFLVMLVATRELGKRDLQAIRAVRSKRAAQGDPT
jgi:stage V sporulation protein B